MEHSMEAVWDMDSDTTDREEVCPMIVELNDVSKHVGTFHMENITFSLPGGYIMGLIGPNGAGKTTLLHLLLGLYRPDAGNIRVAGLSYGSDESGIREQIGTVLLERLFDPGWTLQQNADRYGAYYRAYDPESFVNYLERFSLTPDRKYQALSTGEELKFQLAFALAHAPRLLILDEPAGNFDPKFRDEFFCVLKEFIAGGDRSVILSTHLTEDLDRVADYITYLENGKCLLAEDIETLRDSYRLVAGEAYKIALLPKENVIHVEQGELCTRALVRHHKRSVYDEELAVTTPTIEELMYFMTKRKKEKRNFAGRLV